MFKYLKLMIFFRNYNPNELEIGIYHYQYCLYQYVVLYYTLVQKTLEWMPRRNVGMHALLRWSLGIRIYSLFWQDSSFHEKNAFQSFSNIYKCKFLYFLFISSLTCFSPQYEKFLLGQKCICILPFPPL